ncbi:MAG: hypothetical protein LBD33_03140 [Puniceicoccales bacterium]|jgi:hypothetical protein|nr:hypothetical protein [Puniceicoccales bacterium]
MLTRQRVIDINVADRASFWERVEIPSRDSRLSDSRVLFEVTTDVKSGGRRPLCLVRFVPSGGRGLEEVFGSEVHEKETVTAVDEADPRCLAVKWMLSNEYVAPAIARALEIIEREKVAFYLADGRAVPLETVAAKLAAIVYICICNSNDGKMSTFAVTDLACFRKAISLRSAGNKVTFAFLKGDSPEISNSEIPAREGTRQKFLQALTGSFFTTGISALVTMLSILVSTLITGNSVSITVILTSVITFLIFTAFGMFVYTRA